MAKRSKAVKVNLNGPAVDELERIAEELDIPQSEVMRKGLMLMALYASLKGSEAKGGGMFIRENRDDELDRLLVA